MTSIKKKKKEETERTHPYEDDLSMMRRNEPTPPVADPVEQQRALRRRPDYERAVEDGERLSLEAAVRPDRSDERERLAAQAKLGPCLHGVHQRRRAPEKVGAGQRRGQLLLARLGVHEGRDVASEQLVLDFGGQLSEQGIDGVLCSVLSVSERLRTPGRKNVRTSVTGGR